MTDDAVILSITFNQNVLTYNHEMNIFCLNPIAHIWPYSVVNNRLFLI